MSLRGLTVLSLACALLLPIESLDSAPVVTSITPTSATPGTIITITGTSFAPVIANNHVRFGAVAVPALSGSSGHLSVALPLGATLDRVSVSVPSHGAGWSPTPFVPVFRPIGTLTNRSFGEVGGYFQPGSPEPYPTYGKAFQLFTSFSGPTQGVVIADFDGDGRPDIAVAGSTQTYVFRNVHSTGDLEATSFAAPVLLAPDSGPLELAVGDLNSDGKLDLVCVNSGASFTVWENTGSTGVIAFAAPVTLTIPSSLDPFIQPPSPASVKLADLDHDGWLDIVFGGSAVGGLRNLGTEGAITAGSFAAPVVFPANGGLSTCRLALEDFDGDGRLDLLVSDWSTLSVLRNQSDPGVLNAASFAAPLQLATSPSVLAVSAADLDGDRRPEIITAYPGGVSFFRNQATAGSLVTDSFAARVDVVLPNSDYPSSISVADLNGDGRIEYLLSSGFDQEVLVGINRSATNLGASLNTFVPTSIRGYGAYGQNVRVAVGDLNADGRPDLVLDGGYDSITISQNFVKRLTPAALTVSPSTTRITVPWRRYRRFIATQIYDDGSSVNVSSAAAWSSSHPAVATIGVSGLASATSAGETSIGATFGSFSTFATLAVDPLILGTYAGSPDGRFLPVIANEGGSGAVYAFVVQPDGKVIIGGRFSTVNGVLRRNLARLNDDGSLDPTFDPGEGPDGEVKHLAIDALNRVLIVGRFSTVNGTGRRAAARLLADGSLDTTFNAGFVLSARLRANVVAVRADGRMLVGGYGLETTGVRGTSHLIQLDSTGTRDPSFNTYVLNYGETDALIILPNGNTLVGGVFWDAAAGGLGSFCLTRVAPNGTLDPGFVHGIEGNRVYALALQPDGKIIVGGDFWKVQGQPVGSLVRLNADGTLDPSFALPTLEVGSWGIVKAMDLAPDGKIVFAKGLEPVRLTTTGAIDWTFNATIRADWDIYALHVMPDEKIWTAGGISSIEGGPTLGIARLHGDVSSFAAWRSRYFSQAERDADPVGTAPHGSLADDGIPNLLRYASGLSPVESASQLFSRQSLIQEANGLYLQFIYRRLRTSRDLVYEIGVSADLQNWDYSGSGVLPVGAPAVSNDGLTEDVTVKVLINEPRVFLKQRVRTK